jgi:hypothetical protein
MRGRLLQRLWCNSFDVLLQFLTIGNIYTPSYVKMPPTISFDVIGTCFAFDAPIAAIQSRLGAILTEHSVDAKTLFFSWW